MRLRQWAAREGVNYQTAWRCWRDGKLPVRAWQNATGAILVEVPAAGGVAGGGVVYARVSSHDQRARLDRQVARVPGCVTGQGVAVAGVVREVGSGPNGNRPKLRPILSDSSAAMVVVEHQTTGAVRRGDLEVALAAQGRRVLVVGLGETSDDLVGGKIELLTSICVRLYGRSGAMSRALRVVTAAKSAGVDVAA